MGPTMEPSRFAAFRVPRALLLTPVLVAAVGLGACGTTVGLACETRTQCGAGLSCVAEAPGGICSRGCTEAGSTRECPDGSRCTPFGHSLLLCSTGCDTDAQCRINYKCVELEGPAGQKSCRPELILP
jgi:hypothetical protein